jgi:DUF4097 and DUF4098 domain-containing protein YvlB
MILSIMSQAYWRKETIAINKKWTTVVMPSGETLIDLQVDIHSGNVKLQNAFVQNTSITTSSGNATITQHTTNNLEVNSDSGDVKIKQAFSLEAGFGSMNLYLYNVTMCSNVQTVMYL